MILPSGDLSINASKVLFSDGIVNCTKTADLGNSRKDLSKLVSLTNIA